MPSPECSANRAFVPDNWARSGYQTSMQSAYVPQMPAKVWLAPMSGSTDAPFRRQVTRFGAGAVVSEMVAGESLVAERPDVVRRMCRHDGRGAWIVQLAARRPEDMHDGARLLHDAGVDIIDINMGCPAKQVTGGQSGSALMRDLELAGRIIETAVRGAAGTPVSLKMRLGWDHDTLNAPELARIAESLGVCWITVHGRTRCMFYKGQADWSAISKTSRAVAIPVIANGDIASTDDARSALDASGAAGVMIGRAALGQPWLVAQVDAELAGRSFALPDIGERFASLAEQIEGSVRLYGGKLGVRIVRKHVAASIDLLEMGISDDARRRLRADLCRIDDAAALIAALADVYSATRHEVAA